MSIFPLEPTPPPAKRKRTGAPILVAVLAGLLVLGLAALVPGLVDGDADEPAVARTPSASPAGTTSARPTRRPVTLKAVKLYPDLKRSHSSKPVTYTTRPPVGGVHDDEWLECGAYGFPIRNENAVHDLEHGVVWIAYRPTLKKSGVQRLRTLLPRGKGIMAPYPGLPAKVVVTVWGAQLRLKGAKDPRLPLFLRTFGDGHTAPEPFQSCAGGLKPTAAPSAGE